MKYLITGGAGFIGVNFARKLAQEDHQVIILDNLSRSMVGENLNWIINAFPDSVQFLYADIRSDFDKLRRVIDEVDVVYHLAGQVAVTTSVVSPREDFEINALGTFNILEAIRLSESHPVLIFASTNKVYGGMENIKISELSTRYIFENYPNGIPETMNLDFNSPYGCSKGAADQYVVDYSRIYGLKTVVMRQSCIYGTRQFGVEDQGWVAWFSIASATNKPITIYGDGKQVRDILFVDDLYNAFDLAVRNIHKVSGMAFNIGGGRDNTLSLLELLDILETKLERKINYGFSDWRPGDQPVYISDISLIREQLGWEPAISPSDGVDLLLSWTRENIHFFLD